MSKWKEYSWPWATGTYSCTFPDAYICVYVNMHLKYVASHRCVHMFHIYPEGCLQVPVDKHGSPQIVTEPPCAPIPTCHYLGNKWPNPLTFPEFLAKLDFKTSKSGLKIAQALFGEPWKGSIVSHGCLGDLAMPSGNTELWAQPHSPGCLSLDCPLLTPPSHQS